MGKEVLRPTFKMNLLLSCFSLSALYSTCQHLTMCLPARHHSSAVHKACLYIVMLPVRGWRVGSILNEDKLVQPPFPI